MKLTRTNRGGGARTASVDPDDIRVTHACASWLMDYPGEALVERLDAIRQLSAEVDARFAEPLGRTVAALSQIDPIELAQAYVETFDTRRRGCLYLTYYSSGDTRRRGMALIAIRQVYLAAGLKLDTDELPDHLSVVLEFSAGTSLEGGLDILTRNRPGLELLRSHLESVDSPWHGALEAVCATLPPLSEIEMSSLLTLAADGPEEELVGLDGYGSGSNFDSIYPASRPGPSFDSSGCAPSEQPRSIPVAVTRK